MFPYLHAGRTGGMLGGARRCRRMAIATQWLLAPSRLGPASSQKTTHRFSQRREASAFPSVTEPEPRGAAAVRSSECSLPNHAGLAAWEGHKTGFVYKCKSLLLLQGSSAALAGLRKHFGITLGHILTGAGRSHPQGKSQQGPGGIMLTPSRSPFHKTTEF